MSKLLLLTIVVSLLHIGCIAPKYNYKEEEINRLEIATRRLGTAVQGVLWSGAPPDGDLIAMVCEIDPSLCSAFGNNTLHARVVGGNAVLLLCTPDNKRALVEDIACTPMPDYKAWVNRKAPCGFTLNDQLIRAACR